MSGRDDVLAALADAEQDEREAARKRRLSYLRLDVSGPALKVLTEAQRDTLIRLTQDSGATKVRVSTSFDLPDDWIMFVFEVGPQAGLVGGIDPAGGANT